MQSRSGNSDGYKGSPKLSEQDQRVLLSRDEIEAEYGISRRWLELAALSGKGPPMVKISRRMVRYQRGALEAWLSKRTVNNTWEV